MSRLRTRLPKKGEDGDKEEAANEADMLKEGIGRHEPFRPVHGPEIIGDRRGKDRKDAQHSSTEPREAIGKDQRGADKFDGDGEHGVEGGGLQSEMRLFGDSSLPVGQLDHAA